MLGKFNDVSNCHIEISAYLDTIDKTIKYGPKGDYGVTEFLIDKIIKKLEQLKANLIKVIETLLATNPVDKSFSNSEQGLINSAKQMIATITNKINSLQNFDISACIKAYQAEYQTEVNYLQKLQQLDADQLIK